LRSRYVAIGTGSSPLVVVGAAAVLDDVDQIDW
jgi:hypothetical protein